MRRLCVATGFARVRPVATHNRRITDYCSYRGLMIISGINTDAPKDNPHLIHSDDGKTALWAGALDDMWELGKPVGIGGPWKDTPVKANEPSDPYLMTGYDEKSLRLSSEDNTTITIEIDITGNGDWQIYQKLLMASPVGIIWKFPDDFQAYWIRFRSRVATTVTAQLTYE